MRTMGCRMWGHRLRTRYRACLTRRISGRPTEDRGVLSFGGAERAQAQGSQSCRRRSMNSLRQRGPALEVSTQWGRSTACTTECMTGFALWEGSVRWGKEVLLPLLPLGPLAHPVHLPRMSRHRAATLDGRSWVLRMASGQRFPALAGGKGGAQFPGTPRGDGFLSILGAGTFFEGRQIRGSSRPVELGRRGIRSGAGSASGDGRF